MTLNYHLPPVLDDESGTARAAGFEFEFGNLPITRAAETLQRALGGNLESISPFEAVLHDSSLGRLKIERDADVLKSTRYRKWLDGLGLDFEPGSIGHEIETNIDKASRGLIPCEVVTAPIPLRELQKLDTLVEELNALGAEGTQDSLIYAFGLHINPSLPATDSLTITRYIQAYLLLHSWLVELSGTDLTRRFLTRYIDPFPHPYMEKVLRTDYRPDTETLIDDYLAHNPTRNRALDMLPILAHLDHDAVVSRLGEDERRLVKGRPAFHYRLPDCKVNEPGWSVAAAWNRWIYVEMMANQPALLETVMLAWQAHDSEFKINPSSSWVQHLTSLLAEKLLTP